MKHIAITTPQPVAKLPIRATLIALIAAASAAVAVAQEAPVGGTAVEFPTTTLAGAGESLRGMLWRSSGTSRGTIVLVHGSGGWTDAREGHYARALSAAGYTVLAVDAFGPRGVGSTTEDQTRVATMQMTLDAFAARKYLLAAGEDPTRTAVMGFSKGGQVALFAADATFLPAQAERFKVAIAVYPGCNMRVKQPKPASAMFMLLGEKDDLTGTTTCAAIAGAYERAGGRVQVKVYPNATHAFDGNPRFTSSSRLPTVENYIDCVAEVEPDGSMMYAGKRYPQGEDMAVAREFKATCMKRGATFWTNLNQKQRSTEDVTAFLHQAFPPR